MSQKFSNKVWLGVKVKENLDKFGKVMDSICFEISYCLLSLLLLFIVFLELS